MSHFIHRGNTFRIAPEQALNITKHLPVGTYSVKLDDQGLFLDQIDSFEVKGKIYGDTLARAARIINTFLDRPNSTGVLLSGEKGSGKTLLTKVVSIEAAKLGIPTLIVNFPYKGDGFNTFIQSIDQPCIVLFDEFEKVYDDDDQTLALTLLDGVYPSKKLFLLTVNESHKVNMNMKNRPGRLYYSFEYGGLSMDFIREYCADNLNNKAHTDKLCAISTTFYRFSFDMLKAMVEEMNRYSENAQQVLQVLNAKPQYDGRAYIYDVTVFDPNDVKIPHAFLDQTKIQMNPVEMHSIRIGISNKRYERTPAAVTSTGEVEVADPDYSPDDAKEAQIIWSHSDLSRVEPYTGDVTLVNDQKYKLVLQRVVAPTRGSIYDAF